MSDTSPETANAALARDFLAMMSSDPVGALETYLAEDGQYVLPSTLPVSGAHDKATAKALLGQQMSAFTAGPDITIDGITAQGNRVAVEATGRASLADGRVYAPSYHFLLQIGDGKLQRVVEYTDTHQVFTLFFAG